MVWLTAEEARKLEQEWGIDENEVVITFNPRPRPDPPKETTPEDEREDDA